MKPNLKLNPKLSQVNLVKSKDLVLSNEKLNVEAMLQGDRVVVSGDLPLLQSLHDKGWFGVIINGILELPLTEALYLLERGKISIIDKTRKALSFNGFVRKAREVDIRFMTRYRVYADIRSKGYITKEALKYGADFSVYERGTTPEEEHSKWLLFAVSADEGFNWREFSAMNRVAHSVKKNLLIGILDSQAEVTYYEIRWVRP